jgi:hypothetical protein
MNPLLPLVMLIIGYLLGVLTNKILFGYSFKIYTEEIKEQYNKRLKEIIENKEIKQ